MTALALLAVACAPASAYSFRYDRNLLRLSEILGSMHFLQQLCDSYENRLWRRQMQTLLRVENAYGERRDLLVFGFNRGYLKYQDWLDSCTVGADILIDQFIVEGSELTSWLAANKR